MDDTVARPVTVAVRAHGDADDHLRLAVLLAALGSGDAAAACRDPGATWSERLDALESVLRERDRSQLAVFIDPDALDVEAEVENDPDDRWDDATFRRQRGALLSLLLREFARGAWEIHRPEPSVRLTSMLTEGDSKLEDGARAAVTKLESAETRVAPALRPIVRGLVRRRVMSEEEVAEALDEATDVDRLVLVLSYDALTIDAREAACRLAVLRGPQPLNGVAGPFPIGAGEASISRSALDALVTSGWVTRARGDRIEMARAARRFLSLRAAPAKLEADHAIAAEVAPQTLEQELEQHHHAIGARAVERAVETARFYGADLRLLAIDLGKRQQKHAEAAEIFRVITDRFDREDAYAWEYLGYNLEEGHHGVLPPERVTKEIRRAYERACDLARTNPLYRGRELAFKVLCRERIAPQLIRYARYFAGPSFSDDALAYLAERPLRRLRKLGARDELQEIDRAAGYLLRRSERLRPLLPT